MVWLCLERLVRERNKIKKVKSRETETEISEGSPIEHRFILLKWSTGSERQSQTIDKIISTAHLLIIIKIIIGTSEKYITYCNPQNFAANYSELLAYISNISFVALHNFR